MSSRKKRDLKNDLQIGLRIGMMVAAACALFATIGYFAGGRTAFLRRSGGLGWWTIIGSYALGGLTGGTVIGLLRPLRSSQMGSFLIGFVASIPLCTLLCALIIPREDWFPWGMALMLVTAAMIGGGIGAVLQNETKGWWA